MTYDSHVISQYKHNVYKIKALLHLMFRPVIPNLGKQRQEDLGLEVNLGSYKIPSHLRKKPKLFYLSRMVFP